MLLIIASVSFDIFVKSLPRSMMALQMHQYVICFRAMFRLWLFTSNCKIISHFSITHHHFPRKFHIISCVFNMKFRKNAGI